MRIDSEDCVVSNVLDEERLALWIHNNRAQQRKLGGPSSSSSRTRSRHNQEGQEE